MSAAKTVLITGASSGIGRATALLFAERGWNVAATMRSPEKNDLGSVSPRVRVVKLDVTDPASIDAAVAEVIGAFGAIDVLVNNAGYGLMGPFEAQTDAQIRRQVETNLFGTLNVTRAVLPHMRERRCGRIINITSVAGRMATPLYSTHVATKWALEGFSESLWLELRQHNIKIKIVEPGMVKTDFFDRSRVVASDPGLTAYDAFVARVTRKLRAWEKAGVEPVVVARSIWRAATSNWPRLRYQPNGVVPVYARGLMPGSLYARIVRHLFDAW